MTYRTNCQNKLDNAISYYIIITLNAFIDTPELIKTEEIQEIPVNNQHRNKLIIIILIAIGIAAVLLFLLYKYYAPFGKAVSYKFTLNLPGAEEITKFSTSKDSVIKIPSQIIKTGQSRLSLTLLSKNIQSIHATLKYKNPPKEVTLGVRGNEKEPFLVKPLYHAWLQDLDWQKIEDKGFILWQGEKRFSSLSDFVNNPPPNKEVASYYIDSDKLSLLQSLKTGKQGSVATNTPLRGSHTMLVQVTRAPLIIQVAKQDLNGYQGEDTLKIAVSSGDATITEETIGDDGITDAGGLRLQPQEKTITVDKLEPGIHKVNLFGGDKGDSLITRISINQQKVVFANNIFILGNKPTTLFTNAKKIILHTFHDTALQTVRLDDEENLIVDKSLKDYIFDLEALSDKDKTSSLYKLVSPKNDLIFRGDGYFALSEDAFFDPKIVSSVDLNTLTGWDGINYVLSTWPQAKQEGEWLVSEVSFDPAKIHLDGDKLYFSLEMPDFAKSGGELEIDSLDIEVKSDGILSKAGKEKKEEAAPASAEGKKPTIFSRFFGWVGRTATSVKNAIVSPFVSAWNAMKGFFKKTTSPTPVPTPAKPSPSTSPKPTGAATPSATPSTSAKYDLLIRVLNGGAEKGAAASAAAVLKNNGFTNVSADNAARFDYAGVTIQHRKEDGSIADRIEALLKKEYGSVTKTLSATTTAEAVVIIGKK